MVAQCFLYFWINNLEMAQKGCANQITSEGYNAKVLHVMFEPKRVKCIS